MRKSIISIFVFLTLVISMTSCDHEIVADDIYGYWQLDNDVKFTGLAFTRLEFLDGHPSIVDPVISDTIYIYDSLSVEGNILLLIDKNKNPLELKIRYLHDDVLAIENFPGADDVLEFKKVVTINKKDHSVTYLFPPKQIKAEELPEDSLDINMKNFDDDTEWLANDSSEGEHVILSESQLTKAHNLLKNYMNTKGCMMNTVVVDGGVETLCEKFEPHPFRRYFKQYMGYKKDGQIIVEVSLFRHSLSHNSPFPYTDLKAHFMVVEDGGTNYGRATINLTTGEVSFLFNGLA